MKDIILHINKFFENRIRLGIMSILMVNESIDFKTIKGILDASDGNIASHMNALEKEGFVKIKKQFVGKKPNTTYSATKKGKTAFKNHLDALEKLINLK